jgi:UDP-N-acetyl-D-mannosaminuronate dehydrogenase
LGSLKPGDFDLAIIATAHDVIDHDALAAKMPLVIDTRNACKPASNVRQA